MIIKFLKSKNGGGIGSLNYALNRKRVQEGTARVLRGDESLTRELIESITKKQKTSFAVMSFEEENISESTKHELMDEFEQTFFAGLSKDDYNILWVEHTDKGRLELNAIIPKVLQNGRAYNPYNHRTDLHIKDLLQKKINIAHGFTDPQDPSKEQTLQGNGRNEKLLIGNYQALDTKLKELVAQGAIQDREELIELLEKNNIEVTRRGKDYISVKLPDNKKAFRLKGGIYEHQFTSIDELRDISEERSQRERAFANRNSEIEYREVSQRLERAISKRAVFNAERFGNPLERKRKAQRTIKEIVREADTGEPEQARSLAQNERTSQKARKVAQVEIMDPKNIGGGVNEGIGTDARGSIADRERVQQEARERADRDERAILEYTGEREPKLLEKARETLREERDRSRERRNLLRRSFESVADQLGDARKYFERKLGEFREALTRAREARAIKEPRKPEPDFDEYEYGYGRQM